MTGRRRGRSGIRPWYNAGMASSTDPSEREYVLGTHDAEVERLRFQHGIWRDEALRAWQAAGLGPTTRAVDIGAGPGFAAIDLAEAIGPGGEVLAVERSGRFLRILEDEVARRRLATVRTAELDLMQPDAPIPVHEADLAWCRWVACFVPSPERLVERIAGCLRSGGAAVFHEYVDYGTYRLLPVRRELTEFVETVFESWRADGGEPDIARALPGLLGRHGFRIESVRPIARAARPGEPLWDWPAGFVRVNTRRLVEMGRRDARWAEAVVAAVAEAERDESSVFITPTVLEIIARKR